MSKKLPDVQGINLNSLVMEMGGLEKQLIGLKEIKEGGSDNLLEIKKIEEQLLIISSEINKKTSAGAEAGINPANLEGLSKNREEILEIIKSGLEDKSITDTAEGPDSSSTLFGKTLYFKNKEVFESVKKTVDGIYDNLKEMGLDVRKTEKSEGEKSASFYTIRFPEAYKGERDVMKMTNAEIDEIKSHYEKETTEQKQSVDPSNYRLEALGHKDLIVNKELIFDSLGLRKAKEQPVEQKNPQETNGVNNTERQNNNLTYVERLELENKSSGIGGRG